MASVWGMLLATDAAVLDTKVAAIAATVCDNDPRSAKERRSDAAGAWANGNDHLICGCGSPTCPFADGPAPKSSVVINVVADQAAIDAARAIEATRSNSAHDTGMPQRQGHAARQGHRDPARRRSAAHPDAGRTAAQRRHPTTPVYPRRSTRTPLPAVGEAGAVGAGAGSDVPVPGLHRGRGVLRHRPCHPVPDRGDARVEFGVSMPKTPPVENLLGGGLGAGAAR